MEKLYVSFKDRFFAFVFCFSLLGTMLLLGALRMSSINPQDSGEATVNRIRDRFERLHQD